MASKRPPIIGITAFERNEDNRFCLMGTYVDAVRAAGGVPILLPPEEPEPVHFLSIIDGILFSGGGDIDISLYGGEPHPEIDSVDVERDRGELDLVQHLYRRRLPTLGICRGIQLFAVASGGSLIPHIPDEVGEEVPHTDEELPVIDHPVSIEADSLIAQIMGVTYLEVPSSHHQAAREEPPGWRVVARAPDGIIEAMEREGHPWMIALQWHPERAPEVPSQQAIFRSFIEAARARQRNH